MNTLELARLQFGVTTLFHFIFVPISIGLALWVAICQTLHYRTGKDVYRRMTEFWGKLLLVSMAVGVVTGIVQEFQFGMNWSEYSRYVGDVFGAPLAMEALIAFFLESTFLGLWIFGRGRLSPKLHLVTIWCVSIGTMLSAYFILAANSWMQHPVGYKIDAATGHAQMTSILKVLTNSTVLWAYPHTILGAVTTGGMVVLAVSAWSMLRHRDRDVFGTSARIMLPMVAVAAIGTAMVGHGQGVLMYKQQPMKMAAAEALYKSEKKAGLSLFAVSHFKHNPGHLNTDFRVPGLLSFLANGDFNSRVEGINDIQAKERAKYGPGDYTPIVAVTYWSFRAMVGAGTAMILLALLGLFLVWRKRLEASRLYLKLMIAGAALPIIANWTGWIFTEMGRQPWVVFGLLKTSDARSPLVGSASIWLTLVGYTVVYGVLAAIGGWIALKQIRKGPPPPGDDSAVPPSEMPPPAEASTELVLSY